MFGWLLGGRATNEERRTAAIRCATRDSALKQCVVANSKETCDRLAQDLDLCKGRVACPDAAAEFSRCAHLVVNHTGKQADIPDCSKQLRKMRACLRRKRV
mmetsp:Transcript_3379/g.13436  ORF Transcript_3379/g.13436 Transcript_3379/m.13436 type:complete len:101 (-) Transcript_3379:256-558(-)